jgi:hypothetical protein
MTDAEDVRKTLRERARDARVMLMDAHPTISYEDAAVVALLNVATEQIDTLTRERDEARSLCDETINLLHDADREADTLRTQLAAARVVTDAMIDKGWSLLRARCVEDYYGSLDLVERDDFAAALTAALTQGDA